MYIVLVHIIRFYSRYSFLPVVHKFYLHFLLIFFQLPFSLSIIVLQNEGNLETLFKNGAGRYFLSKNIKGYNTIDTIFTMTRQINFINEKSICNNHITGCKIRMLMQWSVQLLIVLSMVIMTSNTFSYHDLHNTTYILKPNKHASPKNRRISP